MTDEIDVIVDAVIERGSPTLDKILAERDELRADARWLRDQITSLDAENERLKAAVVEIGAAHVAAQAEVEQLKATLRGVLAEADRKTDAFDKAHAALER